MVDPKSIRRVPRFSGVSDAAVEWLARELSRASYQKGELIFLEGEAGERLYLVETGTVKVYKSLESGRELILDLFRIGEAVGEVAVIDGAGYPASAVAHTDCGVLVMTRSAYLRFLREFPEAATELIRDLVMRMRSMSRRMQDLGGGGVDYRVARVLQTMVRDVADGDGRLHVPVKLSRQDLADSVGARVETVIRVMSRWQKEGLVGTDEIGLWVRDRRTIDRLATPSG